MEFKLCKEEQCKGKFEGLLRLGYWAKWTEKFKGDGQKGGYVK